MARIRVSVLGPAELEVDGVPVRLTPLTTRLLVRLVAAEGEPVPVRRLHRDVWAVAGEQPHRTGRHRNDVQKRVLELRRALDPAQNGDGARVLRTEQLLAAPAPETAYRLVLAPDELDCAEFTDLVHSGLLAPPASAADRLAAALDLVRGRPLAEVGDEEFALPLLRRLTALRETARRQLIRSRMDLGRHDLALPVAERMAMERPDDRDVAELLGSLRARLRERHGQELLRQPFPGAGDLVVVRGDLFDQEDANLVVGFTDTFDTATERDLVISRESVQGQLVERLFGGERKLLDDRLQAGLKAFTPLRTERPQDKPRGRRVRYPLGTAVPLTVDGRRVFAVAYSRLGNDLVARSAPAELRASLDALWPAVARFGMYKPVAIPLIGSGLARVVELDRTQLLLMIVESFTAHCRREPTTAPELRIVIRPADLERTDLSALGTFLRTSRHGGTGVSTTSGIISGSATGAGSGTGSAGRGDGGAQGRRW
ncbi:macro domain-containing protein [Streptomyces sp. NPDC056405]|uniref:macro domain-containing protein n=1 Tax=Streptomyces sp. NPDC056405 TaxID=3345811 RepID=UPI0035DD3B63